MRYRAILVTDKKLERPVQVFGNDITEMARWAREILRNYPEDRVDLYKTTESFVTSFSELVGNS